MAKKRNERTVRTRRALLTKYYILYSSAVLYAILTIFKFRPNTEVANNTDKRCMTSENLLINITSI